jgi:hypothetical protein
MLNVKVFRRIGLIVPSHMATQLAIGKTGIAQILLSNLRACLMAAGANTFDIRSKSVMTSRHPGRPPPAPRRRAGPGGPQGPPSIHNTPRGGPGPGMAGHAGIAALAGIVGGPQRPGGQYVYNDDYEYMFHQKQNARAMNGNRPVPKSISNPNLMPPVNRNVGFLPAINNNKRPPRMNNGVMDIADTNEVQYLRSQVKRMEALLQAKNAKIQDLQSELSNNRMKRTFRP